MQKFQDKDFNGSVFVMFSYILEVWLPFSSIPNIGEHLHLTPLQIWV